MTEPNWLSLFPGLAELPSATVDKLVASSHFVDLNAGDIAYLEGDPCESYLMCIDGTTRVFKTSEGGREIVLYRVNPGQTCVLTTSCLLSGKSFPAQSIADADARIVAVPAAQFHATMAESAAFRRFVLDDYGKVISDLIVLVDQVAFQRLDTRLARWLLDQGAANITVTHQQIATGLGSVREVISRQLKEFERRGWVNLGRGEIQLSDRVALEQHAKV